MSNSEDYLQNTLLSLYHQDYDEWEFSKPMSARPWVVVAVMAMMCLMPYQSVDLTNLSEESVKSESSGNSHEILFMGTAMLPQIL